VCPLAFFPNAVDLVVVAAQIKGRVDNREEKTANTAMPIALMRASLPRYAADASSLAKPKARTIGYQSRFDQVGLAFSVTVVLFVKAFRFL
jgi:hypothetical protein